MNTKDYSKESKNDNSQLLIDAVIKLRKTIPGNKEFTEIDIGKRLEKMTLKEPLTTFKKELHKNLYNTDYCF